MNSQKDVIYGLMNELEEALDKGFPLLGYCFTVVKKDTVTNILDKLYAALPDEIIEAKIRIDKATKEDNADDYKIYAHMLETKQASIIKCDQLSNLLQDVKVEGIKNV